MIGFRSRRKVQPSDQVDVIERHQMRKAQADANRALRNVDVRIARLRQQAGQVDR
jgi:hypothetical protein